MRDPNAIPLAPSIGVQEAWVARYNSAGQEQWVARYNGQAGNDGATAIAINGVGNMYVTRSSKRSVASSDNES
jgi:hypothetical protein